MTVKDKKLTEVNITDEITYNSISEEVISDNYKYHLLSETELPSEPEYHVLADSEIDNDQIYHVLSASEISEEVMFHPLSNEDFFTRPQLPLPRQPLKPLFHTHKHMNSAKYVADATGTFSLPRMYNRTHIAQYPALRNACYALVEPNFINKYISVEFSPLAENTRFEEILRDCQLEKLFQAYLLTMVKEGKLLEIPALCEYNGKSTEEKVRYFNVSEWSRSLSTASIPPELLEQEPDLKRELFRRMMVHVYENKIKQLYKEKKDYFEVLHYRVAKSYQGREVNQFYVWNTHGDMLKILDTAIEVDKFYTYDIYAYCFIRDKVVEIPVYRQETIMSAPMPLTPQVEFVPYRASSTRVRINFNDSLGHGTMSPIPLNPHESEQVRRVRISQNVSSKAKIRFTDSPVSVFEIYRSEQHPKNYEQMNYHLHKTVVSDVSKDTPQAATSISFIDDVEANKDYYYMFRTRNIYDHVSNPTIVWRLRFEDDNGAVIPHIHPIEFKKDIPSRKQCKNMQRYLQIMPASQQRAVNEKKSGIESLTTAKNITDIHLGNRNNSLWGKKFKIRAKSRLTGRQFDVNIKFEHTHRRSLLLTEQQMVDLDELLRKYLSKANMETETIDYLFNLLSEIQKVKEHPAYEAAMLKSLFPAPEEMMEILKSVTGDTTSLEPIEVYSSLDNEEKEEVVEEHAHNILEFIVNDLGGFFD